MGPQKVSRLKVAIVGVGLMGGSLAAALKKFVPGAEVFGVDIPETLEKAGELGLIDRAVSEIAELPEDLDLLFLAAPILTNIRLLREVVAARTWNNLLITDMGSTKASIVREADTLGDAAEGSGKWAFIGGHPMAGSERAGVGQANPFLFENAVYVLSTTENANPSQEQKSLLMGLLVRIGARIIDIPADFHDRLVAHVSHLPYIVAVSLVNFIGEDEENELFYQLAAGGYRDLTRIAQGSYSMWSNIFHDNKQNILKAVDNLTGYFTYLKSRLMEDNFKEELNLAQDRRVKMPVGTKGFINPLVDIRVELVDRPGVLADITSAVAAENINIKDIAILKIRENLGGVLQLSFGDRPTADKAAGVLRARGYRIFGE